jgi:hypothetical protein
LERRRMLSDTKKPQRVCSPLRLIRGFRLPIANWHLRRYCVECDLDVDKYPTDLNPRQVSRTPPDSQEAQFCLLGRKGITTIRASVTHNPRPIRFSVRSRLNGIRRIPASSNRICLRALKSKGGQVGGNYLGGSPKITEYLKSLAGHPGKPEGKG